MFTKYTLRTVIIMLLALTLSACSSGGGQVASSPVVPATTNTPSPAGSPTAQEPTPQAPTGKVGRANVESIEIVMRESMPVQISVNIKGTVPDSCTTAGPITQERDGNTFRITVGATRPQDAMCAQVITPFEQSIALDSVGLTAGTYTVEANGVTATFELAVDNFLP